MNAFASATTCPSTNTGADWKASRKCVTCCLWIQTHVLAAPLGIGGIAPAPDGRIQAARLLQSIEARRDLLRERHSGDRDGNGAAITASAEFVEYGC
ncbi:hypothetical protein JMJ56_29800 [Belnapia sp. T18]|uniref:Uncharacterized protein n=1 Tax=Belnapia arida TaxID=2804533 RepID=A0ABS1UBV1_9PROT|nr:hypothetical protein [Belnapia arida]MBL6082174.1 hypothetical protein [Belnapia arida]